MRKQAAKQQAAAPKVKAAKPEASVQGGDLDPKAIALPGRQQGFVEQGHRV